MSTTTFSSLPRLSMPSASPFLSTSSPRRRLALELTALFLAVRLFCSFVMEFDLHTLLDSATLVTTLWVIYMIRLKLRPTYMEDKDNFPIYYAVSLPLVAKQMKKLDLSSIWALLAAFDDPLPTVNFEGAFVKGVESLSWMGNNSAKLGDSGTPQTIFEFFCFCNTSI
ncbi:hypothetical protein Bca101_097551 [Brassica carinata]